MSRRLEKFLGLAAVVAIAAASALAGLAAAETPVKIGSDGIEAEFEAGFSPKSLSKAEPTPISLSLSGRVWAEGLEWVPPLKELLLEGDKHVDISVEGIPACRWRQLQADTAGVRAACRKSLIGSGETQIDIVFPSGPIPVKSELLAFNGGRRGGVTTLYLHAYITVPEPTVIVTKVKIKKVDEGRYGLRARAMIPEIVGGSGSITSLDLRLRKRILSAICPRDRRLRFKLEPRFDNGTRLDWTFVNFCKRRA
ncbi:MAG: hypothetical protein M3335_11630 [Actinomycetota bacterium]|nr:hypothetical protein [Actinomycetota bacterium]